MTKRSAITDAGIGGIADLQAQVQSDGQTLNATGSTQIAGIKLAKDGQPSAKPVQLQFAVAQNEQAMTGQLQKATFTVGRATINAAGTYQASGPTTAINLKVNGDSVPIDELVAFLPALGVRLPQGSQLKGGTLTTALTVSGSSSNPVISGPVHLNNTQLAGFDLGSKLQTLSQLTGGKIGSATGSGTNIRSLSMNIREAGGGIQTDNIALDVAGVGTATGAGSVSAAGALNYNVVLKLTGLTGGSSGSTAPAAGGGNAALLGGLAGMIPGGAGGAAGGLGSIGGLAGGVLKNGIPVAIGGTTSNPTFSPNLAGLASGIGASAGQGLLKGKTNGKQNGTQSNPLGNALGGLLNRH
jgi:AsmA protein